jgi:hypothetical protein
VDLVYASEQEKQRAERAVEGEAVAEKDTVQGVL